MDTDFARLKALVAPVGHPGSLTITTAKLYPTPASENRHVIGHHVGSWHFVPLKRAC